jgi:hypothetical protein
LDEELSLANVKKADASLPEKVGWSREGTDCLVAGKFKTSQRLDLALLPTVEMASLYRALTLAVPNAKQSSKF